MSIFPTPGEVDVVVTSELMESGRAIQRGFATPDRTTLITSTSRVYSIDERMSMGDGRVDDDELLAAAGRASKRLVAADFAAMADAAGSVISASLFGALAGSGALPFTREQFEAPIRAFGKSVEPSLAAFSSGFDAAVTAADRPAAPGRGRRVPPVAAAARRPGRAPPQGAGGRQGDRGGPPQRGRRHRPGVARGPGAARSGRAGARPPGRGALDDPPRAGPDRGLPGSRLRRALSGAGRAVCRCRPDADGAARLTHEAARHIALWMCYQDTIQVAMQKTRRARMERVRAEAKAKPKQLLEVREYLHPQIDEITDTLPTVLGATLRRSKSFQRLVHKVTHKGMILNTTSVAGYTLLTTMARVRPLRPRSLRFGREQKAIEAWIEQALAVADDADLAREIVECQRVLKGYGATYEHGSESFAKLMDAARSLAGSPDAAERLAELREAALADEHGTALDAKLAAA